MLEQRILFEEKVINICIYLCWTYNLQNCFYFWFLDSDLYNAKTNKKYKNLQEKIFNKGIDEYFTWFLSFFDLKMIFSEIKLKIFLFSVFLILFLKGCNFRH